MRTMIQSDPTAVFNSMSAELRNSINIDISLDNNEQFEAFITLVDELDEDLFRFVKVN